jgi:sugar phosphate isomerase/epimerase
MLELPRNEADLERFEKQLLAAKMAGATVARTTMLPGRRYEQFEARQDYERACERGLKAVRLAEPIAARHKFRLALENHKDHLVAEKLEVLKQISSEYVGLCVDVLNNVALLEDSLETVRAFAPYAMTVHFKDESIRESEDGFWLADEALGAGFLDLPAIVGVLRQAKPDVHLNLETITRDPILVPVRTEKYWATFPGRPRSAMEPMLKLAKEKGAAKQTWVSRLPQAEQLALERHNIQQSLQYAREKLAL